MFERFTEKAIKVITLAQEEARRLGYNFFGTEHILLSLIGEGTGIAAKVLKSMGINLKDARVEVEKIIGRGSGFVVVEIPFTPRKACAGFVTRGSSTTRHKGIAVRVLEILGADPSNIRTQVNAPILVNSQQALVAEVMETATWQVGNTRRGKLDPVVGRQPQIKRVVQILARRTCRNNACLIGKPGVGKRAIAEGIAQRIASGDVPETIKGKMNVAGNCGWNEIRWRSRGKIEEVYGQSDDIILFIDEMHLLIGAGAVEGAIDAANILKPALERCELQYRKHIENDPALERRFQPVKVPEPTVEEAIQITTVLAKGKEVNKADNEAEEGRPTVTEADNEAE
ncbi:clpC-like protein [Arabidopsis thaliana]|uniref:ClpC-like protein n=1 Tax=Arabidopsis thaliana TaxID=3702 RepID=Q9M1G2_ARATH|nr:Double Clp-N motif-containing P-loop nucleoside triphosphate hydrolases superfamily protein [Arabidopsis thaliana]AEE78032.1 Double Clp-N motif-containing P-loop nucleoside triphosphate hydrolases superfamily protein [Arabidopsis thaliana]CAB75474.1 clpC-like protein [Arabidopsis thaliana]|eukprot:NP_190131.1 Double Clp-N motif-containing P-loop nucleoside triphosphate hydrolases superfamily protein [Arabidopsis thaliana]